jgi:multidrug efflux pump
VPAISLGIEQQSKANTIQVSDGVRAQLAAIAPTLPEGMQLNINFDRAVFIKESIREVYKALGISLALVLIVIYAFLGTLRATLIPGVVVPIPMLSAVMVMAAMGYSLNTLTLLGLVLAIGLVVDDAIVVLENIYRRIEEGEQPLLAALDGSRWRRCSCPSPTSRATSAGCSASSASRSRLRCCSPASSPSPSRP